MATLNTRIDVNIGAVLANALDLSSESRAALSMAKSLSLSSGTLAGEANQLWFDKRTILASGTDALDLSSGGLLNGINLEFTIAKLKGMFIYSLPANTNNILVGGGATPVIGWVGTAGDQVTVVPGGMLLLVAPNLAGYAVTAGTADLLTITNGAGTSVEYEIVLFGTTS